MLSSVDWGVREGDLISTRQLFSETDRPAIRFPDPAELMRVLQSSDRRRAAYRSSSKSPRDEGPLRHLIRPAPNLIGRDGLCPNTRAGGWPSGGSPTMPTGSRNRGARRG